MVKLSGSLGVMEVETMESEQLQDSQEEMNDQEEVTTSPSDGSTIVDTHVVALVGLEIDAVGNYWEKGHDGNNAPAVGFVEKGKVYEIAGKERNGTVEIKVTPPAGLNEAWEWEGLQLLDGEEWRYARESDLAAAEQQATEGIASEVNPPEPITPEQALRDYQAYVRNLDVINKKLKAARLHMSSCEMALKDAKDELKEAQESVNVIAAELSDACAAAPDPKRYPLFDKGGKSDLPGLDEGGQPGEEENTSDSTESDDSWKAVPVTDLDLSPTIAKLLSEHSSADYPNGIKTIGDIARYTEDHPLTGIKNIGQGKAEKIEEALEKFWAGQN